MPETRYVKVFNKIPDYKNADELTNQPGIEVIEAKSFPHTVTVGIIALIRLDPHFYGTFTLRFPHDTPDYHEMGIQNPKAEPIWYIPQYDAANATFPQPGTYYAALALDGEIIHKTSIEVIKSK